ncbi:MAG: hypothetical protein V1797_16810 [Pseudomonadota bacterium]
MSEQLTKSIRISVEVDRPSITAAQNELNNLAKSLNQNISEGLTKLGRERAGLLNEQKKVKDELEQEIEASVKKLQDSFSQMWGKEWDTGFDSVGTALSKSITMGFSGGLDQAKPLWEKAWIDLASVPEKYLANLIGKLGTSLLDSFTSSIASAVLKPLGDSLGITSLFKDSLSSLTSFASSAGSTVAGWLGIAPAAGGAAS